MIAMIACNEYIEDSSITDDMGEPKGQCVKCGHNWFEHWNFALPESEINVTLHEIRKFQKVLDFS